MEKKVYLEDSLEHLKKYIHDQIGIQFDYIESEIGEEKRSILLNSFVLLMENISHAIDHIKVDHTDDR
jgi:hypothetical protein